MRSAAHRIDAGDSDVSRQVDLLEAPYLLGVKPNPFGVPRFKYASIDTNWRPQ